MPTKKVSFVENKKTTTKPKTTTKTTTKTTAKSSLKSNSKPTIRSKKELKSNSDNEKSDKESIISDEESDEYIKTVDKSKIDIGEDIDGYESKTDIDEDEEDDAEVEAFYEESNADIFNKNSNRIEMKIVPNHLRKTSEQMSLYEYTRIIAERAKQIENGSPIFINIGNEGDPKKIAELELLNKQCPLIISRDYNQDTREQWSANELLLPRI